MILCDTREKANQRILQYFESRAVPYMSQKLDTGDYMDSERMDITIDRKQNLGELLKNMCSPDKSRFWREIRRSQKEGIRFLVLCEHGGAIPVYTGRCRIPGPLFQGIRQGADGADVCRPYCLWSGVSVL